MGILALIGSVRIDSLFEAARPARVRGANVTFEPDARTAWRTHPLGQMLIVTFGLGGAQLRAAYRGNPVR
jgi:quercetin dioxygenase-like cupin family protein